MTGIQDKVEDITDCRNFQSTRYTNYIMLKYAFYILILTTDDIIDTYEELGDAKKWTSVIQWWCQRIHEGGKYSIWWTFQILLSKFNSRHDQWTLER